MTRRVAFVLAAAGVAVGLAIAGVLWAEDHRQGPAQQAPRREMEAPVPEAGRGAVVVPPPRKGDAVDGLLAAVQVGDAVTYRGLTLHPVSLRRHYSDYAPRSFDEAVESGDLMVQELDSARVESVRVMNKGPRDVFIMAGEIMTGSKQDRTSQRDVLIPRRSGWVTIPVYCVEKGRWTVVSPQFGTKRALAAPGLRGMAYDGATQAGVWEEVDRTARAHGVAQSAGRAFQEIYEDAGVQAQVAEYVAGLKLPRGRRTVGFVAFHRGRVLGADLFGSPTLFEDLREKLVRSYVLGLGRSRSAAHGIDDGPHRAAEFLSRAWAEECARVKLTSPGIGESYRLSNPQRNVTGGALVYRNDVVHLSLFPPGEPRIVPVPPPQPIPMPGPPRVVPW